MESAHRSALSRAALSAGVAFSSWTAFSDTASAQQTIPLDTVDVSGQPAGDGSYNASALSSPKQTAPLLDTPQSVTVIPQAIIQEQGARNLTEVLRSTPGITFDSGENGFSSNTNHFKLRGFNASSDVFIDGSRDNGNYARDTFNVERVEVFKGAAADNGRGGAGGYVNIVTKTPVLRNFIAGEVGTGFDQYGTQARKRATVDINRILNDRWTFRFNGMVENSGVPGRDIAQMRPWGLAPSLAYGLGTDFRAIFAYEHQSRRDIPEWGIPAASMPNMIRTDSRAVTANRTNFYGLYSDYDNTDADSFIARFEYDFSKNVTLTNQTRWAKVIRSSNFTAPTGYTAAQLVNTQNQAYDRVSDTITNLTNLSAEFYTGIFRHNVSLGLEVSHEESDSGRYATGPTVATSVFDPNPGRLQGLARRVSNSGIKVDTVAGYLYDTIQLAPQWQFTGGFRVERYNASISSKTLGGASAGIFDGVSVSDTTVGGKVGLVYKPVQNMSYYGAISVSHQPPASNLLSSPDISRDSDDAFPNFIPTSDPIRTINYEVGTKWDFFNGRLSATAAAFHTVKRVPITGCVGGPPPAGCAAGQPTELKGYGEQIAEGIELGLAGNVTEEWKVFAGALWMRTERKHSEQLDAYRMAANAGDYPVGFRNGTNGDALAFSPEFSASLWTTYRIPTIPLTIGGGLQHVGSSWLGRPDDAHRIIPNGVFGRLPSYTVYNLMASYELKKDIDLNFNIDNVADTKYAISTNWPGQRVILGPARTYRIATTFKF
ncbi:MAG: TonB-dependent receptor [Pseudorhodoplanes sp.]